MQIYIVVMQKQIKKKYVYNNTEDNTFKDTKVHLFQMWSSKNTNN